MPLIKLGAPATAITLAAALALTAVSVTPARAAEQAVAPASTMTEGEIRRVDKDARKLTIRHGPIQNLNMPAMTMVFQVKDAAMLDTLNAGDKIRFTAERIGGAYTVTGIEAAK